MVISLNTYIGLDFGGTKLLIGEVDLNGKVLQSKRYETGFKDQQKAVNAILADLDDYMETVGFIGTPVASGMGIVGVVDHENGIWISINHIPGTPIPLAELISKKLGVPTAIDNDVRSATTAELLLGHGKNSKNFIYLNVGTGLAAGLVVNGMIIRGANNNSGEVGHIVIDNNSDLECICGRKGCVENIVSGMGFTRQVNMLAPKYDTKLTLPIDGKGVDAIELFRLADEGDELCKVVTENAINALSCIIMNLVRVTDPDTIILGGGISSDGWILEKVEKKLNPATMRWVKNGIKISDFTPKYLGLIGASALGMNLIRR